MCVVNVDVDVAVLACGLLATCVFVFLAYHYLLSSSGEDEAEKRDQIQKVQKVASKQAKMSSPKASDSTGIPASVLRKLDDDSVVDKTATFTVNEHVRFVPDVCCKQ